jgi:hypothetical protein
MANAIANAMADAPLHFTIRNIKPSKRRWASSDHVDADVYWHSKYICRYTYNPKFTSATDEAIAECLYNDGTEVELYDYSEFCQGLGYDQNGESRRIYNLCVRQLERLKRYGIWDAIKQEAIEQGWC